MHIKVFEGKSKTRGSGASSGGGSGDADSVSKLIGVVEEEKVFKFKSNYTVEVYKKKTAAGEAAPVVVEAHARRKKADDEKAGDDAKQGDSLRRWCIHALACGRHGDEKPMVAGVLVAADGSG